MWVDGRTGSWMVRRTDGWVIGWDLAVRRRHERVKHVSVGHKYHLRYRCDLLLPHAHKETAAAVAVMTAAAAAAAAAAATATYEGTHSACWRCVRCDSSKNIGANFLGSTTQRSDIITTSTVSVVSALQPPNTSLGGMWHKYKWFKCVSMSCEHVIGVNMIGFMHSRNLVV